MEWIRFLILIVPFLDHGGLCGGDSSTALVVDVSSITYSFVADSPFPLPCGGWNTTRGEIHRGGWILVVFSLSPFPCVRRELYVENRKESLSRKKLYI